MITLQELLHSDTAAREGLPNNCGIDALKNLCDLLAVMNCVRTEYGNPIIITSGYRSPALNLRIGGAKNSAHQYGLAVDIRLTEKKVENYLAVQKLFSKFAAQLKYNSIVFWEHSQNGLPSWLHLELSKVKPSKVSTIK